MALPDTRPGIPPSQLDFSEQETTINTGLPLLRSAVKRFNKGVDSQSLAADEIDGQRSLMQEALNEIMAIRIYAGVELLASKDMGFCAKDHEPTPLPSLRGYGIFQAQELGAMFIDRTVYMSGSGRRRAPLPRFTQVVQMCEDHLRKTSRHVMDDPNLWHSYEDVSKKGQKYNKTRDGSDVSKFAGDFVGAGLSTKILSSAAGTEILDFLGLPRAEIDDEVFDLLEAVQEEVTFGERIHLPREGE